jgi:uncharacterized membrane protein YoaK (UPF0700 family)
MRSAHWPAGHRASAGRSYQAAATRTTLTVALAAGAGSLDALAFLALGKVFVSVITGNLVLLGIGLGGHGEHQVALRVAVAVACYAIGSTAGAAIAGRAENDQPVWPGRVTTALLVELVLLAGFTGGWELAAARPAGAVQVVLLGIAAAAMGLQSAAVNRLALPGFSSTYLTSTLIRAVTELVHGPRHHVGAKVAALTSVVVGALAGALLVTFAPRFAPVIAIGLLAAVLVTSMILGRGGGLLTAPEPADS